MLVVQRPKRTKRGFTLIELLIVIAIIAILALIAIPNFLEAQTRSKVSRVMADMRSVATAVEAYIVDYNYPPFQYGIVPSSAQVNRGTLAKCIMLSTPVAYITSVLILDPFQGPKTGWGDQGKTMWFVNIQAMQDGWDKEGPHGESTGHFAKWMLLSGGPNFKFDSDPNNSGTSDDMLGRYGSTTVAEYKSRFTVCRYDPTNGTISAGDIFRFQGD